ncbi:M15 family metallopeptidase [Dermacoccus nishinomiyaensis]|uniref:M15 family metallopeptidase n=1 Tax=Dermacoccus nishinomiyaensis TaxID=1274 RepID=UPI002898690B|nr:M15 family metallopeptidase [Dermacoccus nishinomiyaensis]
MRRTTATLSYRVNVRDQPTLEPRARIVGTLANTTTLTGSYDASGLWFRIAEGAFKGRWVTSAVLVATTARAVNGRLPMSAVTRLPSWSVNVSNLPHEPRYLSRAAAVGYLGLAAAFKARFGVALTITEAYRTLSRQQLLYRTLGYPRAAVPGTSNHGLGNAIDFGIARTNAINSPLYFGRSYDVWLTANSKRWGFDRPDYMDRRGSNPEWWHYNFVGW